MVKETERQTFYTTKKLFWNVNIFTTETLLLIAKHNYYLRPIKIFNKTTICFSLWFFALDSEGINDNQILSKTHKIRNNNFVKKSKITLGFLLISFNSIYLLQTRMLGFQNINKFHHFVCFVICIDFHRTLVQY